MKNYLGIFPAPTPARHPNDWAMYFIRRFGQIDGSHHKSWVMDQVARCLKGTPIIGEYRYWGVDLDHIDHKEISFSTGVPSPEYLKWVEDMKEGGYNYDEGIAP